MLKRIITEKNIIARTGGGKETGVIHMRNQPFADSTEQCKKNEKHFGTILWKIPDLEAIPLALSYPCCCESQVTHFSLLW